MAKKGARPLSKIKKGFNDRSKDLEQIIDSYLEQIMGYFRGGRMPKNPPQPRSGKDKCKLSKYDPPSKK